jgi:hypothetical protein
VFDCVERRYAPLPGCTPPLSLPRGRVNQKPDQKLSGELTFGLLSGEKQGLYGDLL